MIWSIDPRELDLPQVDCEMRDETRKARDEVPSRATKSRNASDEVEVGVVGVVSGRTT